MPIRPLALPLLSSLPPLLLLCRAATAGVEVAVVTEVDAYAEDSGGGERVARHTEWSSLATFFELEPGGRTSCSESDCVISVKLCPRNV